MRRSDTARDDAESRRGADAGNYLPFGRRATSSVQQHVLRLIPPPLRPPYAFFLFVAAKVGGSKGSWGQLGAAAPMAPK